MPSETQLFVKQVMLEDKRYIVCRNEAEAENDRKDRERIVAALDTQLKKGDKALIGNSAYRRYLRKTGERKNTPIFEIDLGKLAEEARFDGIFVLRTNAKITPLQAVLRYRDLLKVENVRPSGAQTLEDRHCADARRAEERILLLGSRGRPQATGKIIRAARGSLAVSDWLKGSTRAI